jgi:hypothetical protein
MLSAFSVPAVSKVSSFRELNHKIIYLTMGQDEIGEMRALFSLFEHRPAAFL